MTIKKSVNDIRDFLSSKLESQEVRIQRVLNELENRIIDSLDRLERSKGKLKTGKLAFKQAQGVHQQIINEFGNTFDSQMKELVKEFSELEVEMKRYYKNVKIPSAFMSVNKDTFKALKDQTFKVYKQLSTQTVNRIAQSVYDAVLTGNSFKKLTNEISAVLVGYQDIKGRPLETYAKTYAQDSLMNYYSTIQNMSSDESELDYFLYSGTVMKDTRPFCEARAGKIFTRSEIESWQDKDWAGKAPGSIWIVRGGYNCRHFFVPVKKEWIENKEV